jgi:hypothetical protein
MNADAPRANPQSLHIYQSDFGRLILPESVLRWVRCVKWRKGKPWEADRRTLIGRAWLRYEERLKRFAQEEFEAGRTPTRALEWDDELDRLRK